ncbi:hypothetical protein TCAL_15505, partial [Tigriopus californicus]
MGNNGGFTLPKGGIKSDIPNQVLKPFATDMVTQGVAVALLAGLGVLSGGAALSALSAQSQLQKLQGNFRTVCNAVRAAGAVDGGAIPIGPPGPPGPVGPPGPAGMDGTCSAAGDDCAEGMLLHTFPVRVYTGTLSSVNPWGLVSSRTPCMRSIWNTLKDRSHNSSGILYTVWLSFSVSSR